MDVISQLKNLAIIASLFIISLSCFSYEDSRPYKIKGFNEEYSSNVNVSGGVLVGIQHSGNATTALPKDLYIAKYPETKTVKVRVLTIDGKYRAAFSVDFEANDSHWVNVGFSSKHQKIFQSYAPKEISVYAYKEVRGKGNKRLHEVFATSWGLPTEESSSFLINSAGDFAKIAFRDSEKGKQTSFCEPLQGRAKTSFNYSCELAVPTSIRNNEIIITTTPNSKGKKYKIWNPKKEK